MDSTGSISTLTTRMMPFLAILRHDLRTLRSSWLVRIWLLATLLLTLLLAASNWAIFPTAPLIAFLLFPYLVFPWFLVVVVLGTHSLSGSQTEALADGILSRPITRYEYILASWTARVLVVVGSYLLVVVPVITVVAMAKRPVPDDHVTLYGVIASLGVVALVLTFLVSIGFLMGTLLRRPLLAVVILVFVWFPISMILDTFSMEEFSPISLNRALPILLRQPFSEEDPQLAEQNHEEEMKALGDKMSNWLEGFSEGPTARPSRKADFFEHADFNDFSLTRVTLGYGIPTLVSLGLTMLCFCWRDL